MLPPHALHTALSFIASAAAEWTVVLRCGVRSPSYRRDDGSGELDFQEFLLGIWNLNTTTDEALIKFCFDIFDIDKGGSLDMAELDALVRMLTGTDEVTGSLKKTLENMCFL